MTFLFLVSCFSFPFSSLLMVFVFVSVVLCFSMFCLCWLSGLFLYHYCFKLCKHFFVFVSFPCFLSSSSFLNVFQFLPFCIWLLWLFPYFHSKSAKNQEVNKKWKSSRSLKKLRKFVRKNRGNFFALTSFFALSLFILFFGSEKALSRVVPHLSGVFLLLCHDCPPLVWVFPPFSMSTPVYGGWVPLLSWAPSLCWRAVPYRFAVVSSPFCLEYPSVLLVCPHALVGGVPPDPDWKLAPPRPPKLQNQTFCSWVFLFGVFHSWLMDWSRHF